LQVLGTIGEPAQVVALVGARAVSSAGARRTHALAADLARGGVAVVSGGALGVDAAAHRGALAAGGVTWAVFGCGLDVTYPPQHAELFSEVVAGGGALISPFPAGTMPRPGTFVARNAVVAGLADVVVVIEASARSGALHTARAALRAGRSVGAVAGSAGCDALLAAGAAVIDDGASVAALLAGRAQARVATAVGAEALALLAQLEAEPALELDALVRRAGAPAAAVRRRLTELEVAGLVTLGPGAWVRRTMLVAAPACAAALASVSAPGESPCS
jgi:DNA processing protein